MESIHTHITDKKAGSANKVNSYLEQVSARDLSDPDLFPYIYLAAIGVTEGNTRIGVAGAAAHLQ